MKFINAARSAPARYALIFAAVSAVILGTWLVIIYWWTTSLIERHLEEAIDLQLSVLRDDFVQDGRESLVQLVRKHAQRHDQNPVHLLVMDSNGKVLAGDLPHLAPSVGWQDIELAADATQENSSSHYLRGLGAQLDANTFILVTNDTADLRQTQRLLLRSFAIALGVTIALSLLGGLAIGDALLRRVDDVNRTARAIMDGDLTQRIPVVGRHDELGGLAVVLNQMLTRIEELMVNVRHVTSSIAHDLRSPLSRHRQRLESALIKSRSAEEYVATISTSISDTDDILKTFDAMLRIAQLEAGTPRERFLAVNLSDIADNVMDAFTAVAEDEGKRIVAIIDPDISVRGERELLTQMLVNLVENAIHHTPVGTNIEMSLQNLPDGVRFTLSDSGPGIPLKERDRVFQHFYRLDASRTTSGNGLGLSFVDAVVKLHDATILLEDNSPGLRVLIAFPSLRANHYTISKLGSWPNR